MAKTIRLHKKHKTPYKYGLNELISSLPRTMTMNDLIGHLRSIGISRAEFYADRNIPAGSEKSIPTDRLLKYMKVFDCISIDEIVLEDVDATSIRQGRIAKQPKTSLQ